ncbi:hypothetical protein Tco_0523411 [Tanacetum coccineum]
MGDENLIRTLGDYSKPSYEGYRNTIELPEGNNVETPWPTRALLQSVMTKRGSSERKIKALTDSDTEEEDTSSTNKPEHELNDMVIRSEGVKEQGKKDDETETDMVVEEVIEEEERRVKRIKVFIGSFTYECDFMILEDTSSIIDRHLGEMIFEKPFIDETGLIYNEEKGTVMFKQGDEKITFKRLYTIEVFKQTWLMRLSIDSIPPSAHEENFGHGRTHYYQSLLIGDEYKQDEGDRRGG